MAEEKDANELLMSAGVPSAKFPEIGATVSGRIIKKPVVQQMRDFETNEPLTYEDGNPKQQIVITLETNLSEDDDDDGVRNLYAKAQMQAAIRAAVRKSGARGLEVGGQLTVTYHADRPSQNRRMKPTKLFKAAYIPPNESDTESEKDDVTV